MSDKQNKPQFLKRILAKLEPGKMIFGLIILLFGLYMVLTMVSFFFTGGSDQSLVENLDLTLTDEIKNQTHNWGGYRGAILAEWLMAKTFGVSCFAIAFFILRCGSKLMGFIDGNIFRLFSGCLFFTLWTSLFFSFIGAENSFFNFGGHCGLTQINWIESQFGAPGAFFVLILTLVIFLYLFKGITIFQLRDYAISAWNKGKTFFLSKKNLKTEDVANSVEKEENKGNVNLETNPKVISVTPVENSDNKVETENNEETDTVVQESKEETVKENEVEEDKDSHIQSEENSNVVENDEDKTESEINEDVNFTINLPSTSSDTSVNETVETEDVEMEDSADVAYQEIMERLGPYDPTEELNEFEMPSLNLLTEYPTVVSVDEEEQKENKDRIVQVLKNFGIEISSVSATVGPTITLYEIVPAPGVRISKIQSLEKDIALSLAAKGIRIIAPIPGKGTIGIEVPNKKPQIVSMKSVLSSQAFQESKADLPVAFGRTITNEVFMVDLAKTPHLLVAGATGMGKSVGLNVLLTSLLYKKHPATLKLVMVDPKQVEFSIYEKIEKHYLAKLPGEANAIITDTTKVVQTLNSLTIEMENRYSLLADVHLRNIKEYNAKFISRRINPAKELPNGLMHHYLPYIVVIIDEYGDLLMTAGKEIETPIARIAQKARAVGIHMVLATQRPSVKIVTGLIKANFPARLAFRVASRIDSQTILDAPGAQELVGKGDMLYSTGGAENTRVQCAFVDTPEVEEINNFIGNEHGYPEAYRLPEYVDENGEVVGASSVDVKSLDPRLKEAAELVINAQNGSTSNIQRTLEVGFNRAGRIMDQLQAIGVVGPVCGSKPREVLVHDLLDLEIIFNNLK